MVTASPTAAGPPQDAATVTVTIRCTPRQYAEAEFHFRHLRDLHGLDFAVAPRPPQTVPTHDPQRN